MLSFLREWVIESCKTIIIYSVKLNRIFKKVSNKQTTYVRHKIRVMFHYAFDFMQYKIEVSFLSIVVYKMWLKFNEVSQSLNLASNKEIFLYCKTSISFFIAITIRMNTENHIIYSLSADIYKNS